MTDNRANEALREVIEATASGVGDDFFGALAQSLASTLGVTHAFVGELVGEKKNCVRTHALCVHGSLVDNMEYALVSTPCENVVSTRSMWHIPTGMREKVPDLGVESYLGLRITDASGNVIGLMSVMHEEPMLDSHVGAWVLTNLAARAGAEMDRMQVSTQLHEMAAFAEMNPSPVLRIDVEGTILLVNPVARTLFPEQTIVGQSWLSLCPEMDRSTFDAWLNSGKDVMQREVLIGDACYLFTYRYDELGKCIHVYGMDITERRRAELKSKRQEIEILHLKDQLVAENVYLQEEIAASYPADQMIGESAAIQSIKRQVALVASTDSTVLIQGETGTGKELIARAIHAQSRRKDRPLITVNCATIPRELIESELFGHARGAFTGAIANRMGRFELANGGTIFLDEVTELPIEMQAKLLRVLQEREFERVGESKPTKIDIRFIAASNIPCEQAMDVGRFRADLFYRLNVFPIQVPPLRERNEDVAVLVMHFVQRFNVRMAKRVRDVDAETMNSLVAYSWPGNIRELENLIERAMILAQGQTLTVEDGILGWQHMATTVEAVPTGTWTSHETSYLQGVIKQANGVIHGPKGAAAILGINPSTLRSRLKRLGIYPKKNAVRGAF